MTRTFAFALSLTCTLICVTAHAQTVYPTKPQRSTCPPTFRPVYPPVYDPYYGPWGHASTYEEGLLNGQANWLRGMGAYNLATSQAQANREVARQLAIQNRQEAIRAYFENKDRNAAYRQAQRQPLPRKQATDSSAVKPASARVTIETCDPQTGAIAWPQALQTTQFDQQRQQVEQLVTDGVGLNRDEIRALADAMKVQLKQHIREIAPMDYLAAGKFLTALPNTTAINAAPANQTASL